MAKNMTQGNLVRILIGFSIPLILSGLLQQLYNWADAFIVGNIEGELALAAIGATGTVWNLFVMVITGFTSGLTILSARLYGDGETEKIRKILSSFLVVVGGAFLLLGIVGFFGSGVVLGLLHTPQDIFMIAKNYLQIILTGIPFIAVYNVYSAVLRGMGDSRAPFLSVVISSGANVLLDIIFVGVLHWGAEGAAVATVISQIVMTVFICGYSIKKYEVLKVRFGRRMIDGHILREGCSLGLPITVQSGVSSAGNLVLQNFMNGFGTQTVAAITTAYRVDTIIMLPVINLGTGISTVAAQNMGAGDYKRAKKSLGAGVGIMTIICLCLTALVITIGGNLISMFGVTAGATNIGREFFSTIAWFYLVFGLATAIRGYLEGIGDVLFSSVCGILALGIRILLSYTLAGYFGKMVIAYAEAFSWCSLFLLYLLRYLLFGRSFTNNSGKGDNGEK